MNDIVCSSTDAPMFTVLQQVCQRSCQLGELVVHPGKPCVTLQSGAAAHQPVASAVKKKPEYLRRIPRADKGLCKSASIYVVLSLDERD